MNEFTKDRPTAEQLVEKLDNELEMTICSDVVHGLDYEYKQLQQENQELKKQLEEYKLITIDYQELEARNKDLENQQKEFIKWLESEIKACELTCDLIFNHNKEMKIYKEILSKYKEIIGDKE